MNESKTIKLIIPGEPVAQQRHRSVIMPRKGVKAIEALNKTTGKVEKLYRKGDLFMNNYDPSYRAKRERIRWIASLAPESMLRGPVRVDRFYYFSYLAGHYGTGKNAGQVKVTAPIWKATRPDIDNFDKFLFDILSGLFFRDDGQIAAGVHFKQYSEYPRTEVNIIPLDIESEVEELKESIQFQVEYEAKSIRNDEITQCPARFSPPSRAGLDLRNDNNSR
jgi:Holliday junction resolvase RusA-like endonuclease